MVQRSNFKVPGSRFKVDRSPVLAVFSNISAQIQMTAANRNHFPSYTLFCDLEP